MKDLVQVYLMIWLLALVAFFLTGCTNHQVEDPDQRFQSMGARDLYRYVDEEKGVTCYAYWNTGSLSCVKTERGEK